MQLLPRLDRWLGVQFAVETSSEPFLVVDFNLDGRQDVITGSRVLYQDAKGGFASVASDVLRPDRHGILVSEAPSGRRP